VRLLPESLASLREPTFGPLRSQCPSAAQVESHRYREWLDVIHEGNAYHRKVWEWCYILEALRESNSFEPGSRALGFGVGREPIVAAVAARGVHVQATDQPATTAEAWTRTNQFSESLDGLRNDGICNPSTFGTNVSFRPVDMTQIPKDLRDFDMLWSSCCLEHLGSPQNGLDFVLESLECLRRGGVAVHTTEFDIGPCRDAPAEVHDRSTVVYRRKDIEALVLRLRRDGHHIRANFRVSRRSPQDRFIDTPPYQHDPHLRVQIDDVVATSFGLVIVKKA
jgi:hypothetical protein